MVVVVDVLQTHRAVTVRSGRERGGRIGPLAVPAADRGRRDEVGEARRVIEQVSIIVVVVGLVEEALVIRPPTSEVLLLDGQFVCVVVGVLLLHLRHLVDDVLLLPLVQRAPPCVHEEVAHRGHFQSQVARYHQL